MQDPHLMTCDRFLLSLRLHGSRESKMVPQALAQAGSAAHPAILLAASGLFLFAIASVIFLLAAIPALLVKCTDPLLRYRRGMLVVQEL